MSNTSLLGSYGAQDSSSLMFRNRVINGDMRIAQRGVESGATASSLFNIFVTDRFTNYSFTGTARVQQTDVTNLPGFNKALRYTVGSASSRHLTTTRFEGHNVADLAGQQITFSFWVRGSKSFTFGFMMYINTTPTPSSLVKNISVTTSWQKIELSFTLPSTLASLVAGQAFETVFNWYPDQTALTSTEMSFVSGDKHGITGTTYAFNSASDWVELTGVQLEAGPTATPFERRPIGTELQMAMRYFQIGSVGTNGISHCPAGYNSTAYAPIQVPMRTSPALSASIVNVDNLNVSTAAVLLNGGSNKVAVLLRGTCVNGGFPYWDGYANYTLSAEL